MSSGNGKLSEAICPAKFLCVGKSRQRIEIFNFSGDLAIVRRGVEMRDFIDAALAGDEVLPELSNGMAERRDDAQTGDDDSAIGNVLSHKNQTGQLSRSCGGCPGTKSLELLLLRVFDVFDDIADG